MARRSAVTRPPLFLFVLQGSALGFACACATPSVDPREAGQRAIESGRHAEAIAHFDAAIASNPEDPRSWFGRGSAKLRRIAAQEVENDILSTAASASRDLTEALRLAPTFAEAYYSRAMSLCVVARYKDAARDLLSTLQLSAEDALLQQKCHRKLAILYDEKFEDKAALSRAHLEQYVALGGDDPKLIGRLSELRALVASGAASRAEGQVQERQLERAKEAAAAGDLNAAAEALSAILKSPELPGPALTEAKMLYAQVRLALQQDREAMTLCDLAERLATEPGKADAALAVLDEVLRRFPSTAVARVRAAPLAQALRNKSAPPNGKGSE